MNANEQSDGASAPENAATPDLHDRLTHKAGDIVVYDNDTGHPNACLSLGALYRVDKETDNKECVQLVSVPGFFWDKIRFSKRLPATPHYAADYEADCIAKRLAAPAPAPVPYEEANKIMEAQLVTVPFKNKNVIPNASDVAVWRAIAATQWRSDGKPHEYLDLAMHENRRNKK